MKDVLVSIIIVNYNGLSHLKKCIPSLVKTEKVDFEIIVVDNGSDDESVIWLNENCVLDERYKLNENSGDSENKNCRDNENINSNKNLKSIRVVEAKANLGFGRANELGVKVSNGNMIAFLNNDTKVDPDWLINMVNVMAENPKITAACSTLMLMEYPHILNALGGGMSKLGYGFDHFFGFTKDHPAVLPILTQKSVPVLFPTAASMLMSKKDFWNVGGFDKAIFMYHEDVDLGWRIWLSGGEVHLCPKSIVYHCFGGTTSVVHGSGWRDRLGMRHNVRTIIKCYRKKNVINILKHHINVWRARKAWSEMTHVLWWNLLRLPDTILERIKIQRSRTISDEELITNGLITDSDFPRISPHIPQINSDTVKGYAVKSSSIFMGDEVSAGRVGYGWYFVETLDGKQVRWNNGDSQFWLKIEPNCVGTIKIDLFLPGPPLDGSDKVFVNLISVFRTEENVDANQINSDNIDAALNSSNRIYKECFEFEGHSGWKTIEAKAQSDSDGIVEIKILSSTWSPHTVFNNGDVRILGCAVERVDFIYDKKRVNFIKNEKRSDKKKLDFDEEKKTPAGIIKNDAATDNNTLDSLTVIIPTYNRKDVLKDALETLKRQTLQGFQVIVVDDGSTDGTLSFLNDWKQEQEKGATKLNFSLEILWQKNQKQGAARNYGLKSANGNIIMFIGDDIFLEPNCLETHLKMHKQLNKDGDTAILGFTDWDRNKMKVSPFLDFINNFGAQFGYKLMQPMQEVPFTCFYTSHISMSRSVLKDTPFDSSFKEYGWEDIDLGYRLCLEGLKIVYVPEARAAHLHPTDIPSFLNRQYKVGFAVETLLKMHPALRNSRYLPTYTPQLSPILFKPIWYVFIRAINFMDQKFKRKFSLNLYNSLISKPFYKGWGKRIKIK